MEVRSRAESLLPLVSSVMEDGMKLRVDSVDGALYRV
jgi:hypothetical protein